MQLREGKGERPAKDEYLDGAGAIFYMADISL
jgi:hypothetical protein